MLSVSHLFANASEIHSDKENDEWNTWIVTVWWYFKFQGLNNFEMLLEIVFVLHNLTGIPYGENRDHSMYPKFLLI